MAELSTYALISEDELREALAAGGMKDTSKDSIFASVCNKASDVVERHLDRQVVTRGALTGYFSPPSRTSRLYLMEWPVLTVTAVYEDPTRTYSTALVNNTDYIVSKPASDHGYISRVFAPSSAGYIVGSYGSDGAIVHGAGYWLPYWRSVKVTYTAGYASTEVVPDGIKLETLKLAVKIWSEWKSGNSDIGSEAGPMGHFTRLSSAYLTDRMKEALYTYKRPAFDPGYEERDA